MILILCDPNLVRDYYHYLLICPYFTESRENHMNKYFYGRSTSLKFDQLLTNTNKKTKLKWAMFTSIILNQLKLNLMYM